MARKSGTTVENQFIQGLITEATGLNFPEKAVAETWNVRFHKNGNITRRLGYAYEDDVTAIEDAPAEAGVCVSFLWKAVGNDGTQTLLAIQTGGVIAFYEPDENGNFSAGLKTFSVLLDTYKTTVSGVSVADAEASMTSGNGKLFINHPFCEPVYVEYSTDDDDITVTQYEIEVRDIEGVEDGLEPDENPVTLTALHQYNLYNQGWDTERVSAGFNNSHANAIEFFLRARDVYPSNSEIWWAYKGANSEGKETLQYDQTRLIDFGNSLAPKGHYIDNAFAFDRGSRSGLSGIEGKSSEGQRPSAVAFYAGRVWYAGIAHPDYQGKVYYTQILERDAQIGKCYQNNDPTSEQLSDLLDSDGGEITVTGMGRVTAMYPVGNVLYLFANNGIWVITGSGAEGTGFVATDFAIKNISNTGTESRSSFVNVEGNPMWWNFDGIWTLGEGGVQSVTNNTIKTFFQSTIPGVCRRYAQGAYNPLERTVQWLWKSTAPTDVADSYRYDRILELNLNTGAFYPFKWTVTDQAFSTIFCATDITYTTVISETVTDSSLSAVTDSTEALITALVVDSYEYTSSKFKYFATNLEA